MPGVLWGTPVFSDSDVRRGYRKHSVGAKVLDNTKQPCEPLARLTQPCMGVPSWRRFGSYHGQMEKPGEPAGAEEARCHSVPPPQGLPLCGSGLVGGLKVQLGFILH